MKIKVCGMRNSDNITELVKLTPDYIGFIFYDKSKRFVADFPEIKIPKSIKKVGVFVNETIEEITRKVVQYDLQAVQLHGDETPAFCRELKSKICHSALDAESIENKSEMLNQVQHDKTQIIKAFAVGADFDFSKTTAYEKYCDLFLFDTKGKEYGGNGVKYDWNILRNYKGETPYLLSGGITENDVEVVKELQHSKFAGVDLNSGFEDVPAIKNIEKLNVFINKLKINRQFE